MSLEGSLDVTVGDGGVEFEFAVHNAGDEGVEMRFPDAQTFDVVVTSDDEEVWRFSEGTMFAQMLQQETLSPGETETFGATWDDPESGEYRARGTLTATNADCEATAEFSV